MKSGSCYTGCPADLAVELEAAFEILMEETSFYVHAYHGGLTVFTHFAARSAIATVGAAGGNITAQFRRYSVDFALNDPNCYDKMVASLKQQANRDAQPAS